MIAKNELRCAKCGNTTEFVWKGKSKHGKRFVCKNCGTWGHTDSPPESDETFSCSGDEAQYTFNADHEIMTPDELNDELQRRKFDLNTWRIDRFLCGKATAWRKDRSVKWKVEDGRVIYGEVDDTGGFKTKAIYSVKVWFQRKSDEIRAKLVVSELKAEAKQFAPKYPKLVYPKVKDGLLLVVGIFDLHFGRLCWGKESGTDFDVKIAEKALKQTLGELLAYAQNFNISKILIPFAGDYFNSNSKANTTVKGTAQQEDTRYSKTFKLGRQLAVSVIDECSQIAPTDVLVVKGNHDEERLFYLGDALECWFHKDPNVTIDNSPKSRKYVSYGKTLLGFTHGSEEKLDGLPMLMALEAPDLWAKSTYREFHTGDKHHRYMTVEKGVVIRIVSCLAAPDQWTYDKGFIGSLRASESFLFHPEEGLVGQFTASAKD